MAGTLPAEPAPRRPLARKLALALALLAALLLLFLFGYLGPRTAATFVRRSAELQADAGSLMRTQVHDHTEQSRAVLTDLIAHTTEGRGGTLADLPLALYAGDPVQLRDEILRRDALREAHLRRNAAVLTREMERRANERIDAELRAIAERQRGIAAEFAADLERTNLLLSGAVLAALLAVLGLGLYRFVVRPVAQLRSATRQVAAGDLGLELPAGTGDDELGALARDFAAMVRQLRASREELTRLNQDLEQEVARKTEHLQRALADLQATHRQLLQAEKMASIGTLAGGIAHEFNNLIGGIRGCAAEAREEEADPRRQETLEVILRAADKATGITRQLLRFARPSMARPAELDVAAVLFDALQLLEPEARRRGVDVQRDFAPGLLLTGDADALHQVFLNLFTNALQAMSAGGTLTVAGRRQGSEVVVQVTDTGVGIPAADLERVFEPFFTSKDRGGGQDQPGSGLGLSVSYGIVAAHGGRIAAESRPGEGAVFTVHLPASGQPRGPAAP